MLKTHIGRLRFIAILEAISFLLLLGVAMPLKYAGGIESAVRWTGWAHGVLFVLFCFALLLAMRSARWSVFKAGLVFIAALLPFGPFILDRRLKDEDSEPAM